MSIIALIRTDDYILMGGDGVCSNPETGEVAGYMSKLTLLPEYDCILGVTGVGGFPYVMQWFMPQAVTCFDDLVEVLPSLVLDVHTHMVDSEMYRFGEMKTNVVVAGWSEIAGTYKAYRVMTYEKESINHETGAEEALQPWTLYEMPERGMWSSAAPPQETLERFGVGGREGESDADLITRMICAGRNDSGKTTQDGMPVPFNAGGFIQLALLERAHVRSWITHRWPEDVIGEPIDPERGSPLPPYLMEKDAQRALDDPRSIG